MSYLELTNRVLRRFNEVELTSSNFIAATGFYATAKTAVNDAIMDIHKVDFEWPFNYVSGSQVMTGAVSSAGITTYALPASYSTVDWDTFHLQADASLTIPTVAASIRYIDYDEWNSDLRSNDENIVSGSGNGRPQWVTKGFNDNMIFSPPPNQNYTVTYTYWSIPTPLTNPGDLPTVPVRFWPIIIDGATMYAYMFRENLEAAAIAESKFTKGIGAMRKMVVNNEKYFRAV